MQTRRLGLAIVVVALPVLSGCLDLYIEFTGGGGGVTGGGSGNPGDSSGPGPGFSSSARPPSSSLPLTSSGGILTSSSTSGGASLSTSTTGSSRPPVALQCQERCSSSTECASGFECVNGSCTTSVGNACTETNECVARYSGWSMSCLDDGSCSAGFVCVLIGGEGLCATSPGAGTCSTFMLDDIVLTHYGVGDMVTVCGSAKYECEQSNCVFRCANDPDCGTGDTPVCNLGTRRCECTATSCTVNSSVCDNGVCKCASNLDCDGRNVDTCTNGACGCASVASCTALRVHPGTTYVCE